MHSKAQSGGVRVASAIQMGEGQDAMMLHAFLMDIHVLQ